MTTSTKSNKKITEARELDSITAFLQARGFIHLFDGEKGGVGKSWSTNLFVQRLIDRGKTFYLFEADRSNPDAARKYKRIAARTKGIDLSYAVFSDDPDKTRADDLVKCAKEKLVVVSLPSQVERPLSEWLVDGLEYAQEENIKFCRWFSVEATYESLNLLRLSLLAHGHQMQYVVIRNHARSTQDEWDLINFERTDDEDYSAELPPPAPINFYETDDSDELDELEEMELQQLIKRRALERKQLAFLISKYNVPIIDIPRLSARERFAIDDYNLSFTKALTSSVFADEGVSRSRIRRFLREVYQQFESTGLLQP